MEGSEGASRASKCARRASGSTPDGSGSDCAAAHAGSRPTPAEELEALEVIKEMKKAKAIGPHARAKTNVVACAIGIAMWRGEPFASDRAALLLFGAHPKTKVRKAVWFDKLDEFAPAGF